MRVHNWTNSSTGTGGGNDLTYSARRVIVGHCPDCCRVLVVFNDGETWPLVGCECGWRGATDAFDSVRFNRLQGVRINDDQPAPMALRLRGNGALVIRHGHPRTDVETNRVAIFRAGDVVDPDRYAVLTAEVDQ